MQIDMKSKYNIAHSTTSGFHLPFHLKCERSHSIFGIYKCIFGLSTMSAVLWLIITHSM